MGDETGKERKAEDLDFPEITRILKEAIRRGRREDLGTRKPKELSREFGLLRDGHLLRATMVLFWKR